MRTGVIRCIAVATAVLVLAACQPQGSTPVAQSAAPALPAKPAPVVPTADGRTSAAITAEDFAARLKKVSSNEFEGRKPGALGERITTAWIKDQFEQLGLKAGNKGNWFQTVPMVETSVNDADQVTLDVSVGGDRESFAYRKDLIVGSLNSTAGVDIKDSQIVFAGYGVDAPEYQWNDYAGLDVKGKTVIVLVNDPGWGNHDDSLFKGPALTYYGRWMYKFEEAARKGAAACLIVHETAGAGYPWEVVVNSWDGVQDSLPASEDPEPRLAAAGWITTDAARRLFTKAGKDFDALKASSDQRGFTPSELGASASLHFVNTIAHSSSENVVGMIRGSTRPDEVVVYSAHWDHFGRDPQLAGDQIYNGAIDNGTGIAALLELAEAFAHQDPPSQRSLLFIADTLEEAGLLGSRYYVTHPSFPLTKTVADINIDALPIMGLSKDVAVISWGQSEIDALIQAAASAQGRSVVPDDAPEKGFFFRSDQLHFARFGVPVLYLRSGLTLVDGGEEAGRKAYADYTANRYHKVTDEYDPNWDFRGVIQDIEAMHVVGRQLADGRTFPQWNAGADFHRPQVPAAASK
ncbi:MAG: M28 family metallopeptidase [Dokdonella sp.]